MKNHVNLPFTKLELAEFSAGLLCVGGREDAVNEL